MKLRKAIVAMAVTGALSLSVSSSFAATMTYKEGENWDQDTAEQTIPVYATSTLGSDKYAADIEWGTMEFVYSGGDWDVDNHEYGTSVNWTIDGTNNQILVRNHSNKPISVAAVATKESDVDGIDDVTINVTPFSSPTIEASPVTHTPGNDGIPTSTATVSLTGQPSKTMNKVQVGSITVTVTKVK